MSDAVDVKIPDGDYVLRANGYAAMTSSRGDLAIYPANIHPDAVSPDPVEATYPGYSNMALVKLGRAIVSAYSPLTKWPTLGQAYINGKFAGVTGGLFVSGHHDVNVQAEITEHPVVAETLEGVDPIDQAAGLADQYRAELSLGIWTGIPSVGSIVDRAVTLISVGKNIH